MAAKAGATYILSHIIDNPSQHVLLDALAHSTIDGHPETVAYLLDKLDSKYPNWTAHIYVETFSNLMKIKKNDLLDYILNHWIDTLTKHPPGIRVDLDGTFKHSVHDAIQYNDNAAISIIVHAFHRLIPWVVIANVLNVERRRMTDTDPKGYYGSIEAISDVLNRR